ncbi:MAG: hypothetical protein IT353_06030 [Gemmatimonadaceae bacterium]|nr:hypothetical protein [Gemmatimonadaceae bacterium]
MMARGAEIIEARGRVVGIVRGREINADAQLALDEHSLAILWDRAAPWRLALDGIDGLHAGDGHLTLYLASGDVLDVSGDDALRLLGAQLQSRACAVPELTRGLRTLGSRRAVIGNAHDAWFAPLMSARRAIDGVSDPLRQVTLVDAANLSRAMTTVISQLAAIEAPTDVAAQRAIEAILEEAAEPMFEAMTSLALAADILRASELDTRFADWRRWIDALRAVFVAADDSWVTANSG